MQTTWRFIKDNIKDNIPTVLLYVVESTGSSPGRKGFVMAVNQKGIFEGTIGGGIMEVKMIELAKSKLAKGDLEPVIRQQFHDKKHTKNRSGLICSGEQTVVLFPLQNSNLETIDSIVKRKENLFLEMSSKGFSLTKDSEQDSIQINSSEDFFVKIKIAPPKRIHIFGGGHVGTALSKQMAFLNYYVVQYDDRMDLVTMQANSYAHEKKIIDFGNLPINCEIQKEDIVVIVSFSYRTDKTILLKLYKEPIAFIGMMGSDAKIKTLRAEMLKEGINENDLKHVHMPIGVNIFSKKAEEIAVSIAGQIILENNRNLPTGRSYD